MEKKIYKSLINLKEDGQPGEFTAVFSSLNVIDHDGDVTVPGAFQNGQKVRISAWGHKWQDLPVGMGVINSDEEKAWVDGQFFLDTLSGEETYKTVKNLGDLQEWSYGFEIQEADHGTFEEKEVRFLRKLDVFEVSPVLLGAGINTYTESIKSSEDDQESKDHDDQPEELAECSEDPTDVTEDEADDSGEGQGKSSGLRAEDVQSFIEILLLEEEDD